MNKSYIDNVINRINADTYNKLETVGLLLERSMKDSMRKGTKNKRSVAGEIPHVDSGTLKRSIHHKVDKEVNSVKIGTILEYGLYLELGTVKMQARPWLTPAVERERVKITAILGKTIKG